MGVVVMCGAYHARDFFFHGSVHQLEHSDWRRAGQEMLIHLKASTHPDLGLHLCRRRKEDTAPWTTASSG